MPERLAYDEAMQLSAIRLKLPDLELKRGKVEMVSIPTAHGPIERPWGIEGGFAVVYKFRRQNGSICALRCFRVPMNPDTQFRYERIGPYFHAHAGSITAGFKYYDAAIVVKEQGKPQDQKYPVIEMDWIDGVTLVEKLDELCRKRQRAALQNLSTQWIDILRIMERAHIAHGDLAGVNVMVRDDGRLVLIDYDGVYIPEFAGFSQVLIGQDDFQHPQMAQRPFSEHMDAFSALVIYTALLALTAKPELWDSYARLDTNGKLLDTNMLFRKQDFQDPQQSPLFHALEQLPDAHIKTMVRELKRACQQSIQDVRFPFALVDPEYKEKQ
ncbi:MAG TPA: RIO1 family regulatory kinase/ATPase, partial [Ktedonobacteraceae bacterium]|nr:RIO1 family regulatory kinase/ATPase [Ktedonobacteraceae bacterium]